MVVKGLKKNRKIGFGFKNPILGFPKERHPLCSLCLFLRLIVCFVFVCVFFLFYIDLFPRSFAKTVGCEMTSLKACAKKKSFQELLSAQLKVFDCLNFFRFTPVVDGYFMPGMC